jgi:hypothetical protein
VRSVRYWLVVIGATLVLSAGVPQTSLAQDYDMSFSLPTYGKSGCMVCHGDPNLVRVRGDQSLSYWIDEERYAAGAHGGITCTGCHLDFSYTAPHAEAGAADWETTAKLACKNCHEDQYEAYSLGVHSISNIPGEEDTIADAKPLCGDCHGAHDIQMLTDNPEGQRALRAEGRRVCGVCHKDWYDAYGDYYHGAAYKRGAPDAPACWQCHGYHNVHPSADRQSPVHEGQLARTCGQCHEDVEDGYLTYTELIHGRRDTLEDNPAYVFVSGVRDAITSALSGLVGVVQSLLT